MNVEFWKWNFEDELRKRDEIAARPKAYKPRNPTQPLVTLNS